MYRKLLVLGMAACLCGCVRREAYERPVPPVPNAWPDSAGGASGPEAVAMDWREFFTDRKLQSVIDLALTNNRDLRMAAINVERVQALYRIRRAEQFPGINVGATREFSRVPEGMSPTGEAQTAEQHLNVGSVSWELDFFGRIRSLKSQALEQFLATEQARAAAQIALVSSVANSYLSLAASRDNLRLAQETLETQQAAYELIRRTREAGIASNLDLRQAQSQVETARVDIARYAGRAALDENALNLLVGTPVPADLLPDRLDTVAPVKEIGAALPSEVLLRRPDILMAEHQLRAAYANIGAARAAFFPRISLTGGAGFISGDLTDLYKFGSRTWNFVPQLVLPFFDAGARQANLKVAQADRDSAVAQYERAIQSAFREVSDSLTLRTRLMEQEQAQQALVDSLEETYKLSEARYKAGIDSYLSVLVAQRALYGAQQALVGLRSARLSNLVTLYKVLGGGA